MSFWKTARRIAEAPVKTIAAATIIAVDIPARLTYNVIATTIYTPYSAFKQAGDHVADYIFDSNAAMESPNSPNIAPDEIEAPSIGEEAKKGVAKSLSRIWSPASLSTNASFYNKAMSAIGLKTSPLGYAAARIEQSTTRSSMPTNFLTSVASGNYPLKDILIGGGERGRMLRLNEKINETKKAVRNTHIKETETGGVQVTFDLWDTTKPSLQAERSNTTIGRRKGSFVEELQQQQQNHYSAITL